MRSISVIVPIYYGKKYIPGMIQQIEACRGYLEQGDQIEILFVNDSPAEPLDFEWRSETVDITIINTDRNVGIHGARLKGLAKCRGEYILFLDQDDRIRPEYFDSQLQSIGEADAVICMALNGNQEVYTDDKVFEELPVFPLKEWNRIVSPGQILLRKDSISEAWTENVMTNGGADDWFLWICMSTEKRIFALNKEILYEHVLQGANVSGNVIAMLQSERELFQIIWKKRMLSDDEFASLLEGFFKQEFARMRELSAARKKLEVLEKLRGLRMKKKSLAFFSERGIQNAAIYGCGIVGEYLYDELKETINVNYFIDKKAKQIKKNIPVYTLQEGLPETDSVIITLMAEEDKVAKDLKNKGFKNIIILREWLADDK